MVVVLVGVLVVVLIVVVVGVVVLYRRPARLIRRATPS